MRPRPAPGRPGSAKRQVGFTLLEAIVAMVLVASVGLALFAWINGSIASLSHVHDANARSEATMNIVEFMHRVNPMIAPEGKAELGAYSIVWRARPVAPLAEGVAPSGGVGLYRFGLYTVEVAVRNGGESWFDLELRQVGYRRVRDVPVD